MVSIEQPGREAANAADASSSSSGLAAVAGEIPRLSLATKLLFCSGAMSTGIKNGALTTFLLVFYNQAIGLPPQLVGTAILIVTIIDAFLDPLVGLVSDNFRSRLGRRHPFMYLAAIPLAIVFVFLWNPPDLSHAGLFIYLLCCLLAIRIFDTFYEVPASALIPELARGYDQRTSLLSIRHIFEPLGGLLISLLAYQVFMREGPGDSGGVTERAGYLPFSITGAAIIFTVIVVSAVSTHKLIPQLKKAAPRKINFRTLAAELVQPLRSRDFVVLAVSGILISILAGLDTATRLYFSLYFWGLTQDQLSMMVFATVGASLMGPVLAHFAGRRLGKKLAAAAAFSTAVAFMTGPVMLRLLDMAPENGTRELFQMLLVTKACSIMFIVTTAVLIASLVADIVEVVEVRTGVRSEGVVISANQLFRKIVSGVGVFLAGWLLSAVDFPADAQRGGVDVDTLRRLALGYLPIFFLLAASAMLSLFLLRGTRESHQANLETLRRRAAGSLPEQ